MLTIEQYEQIDKHISTMKLIITNKSMSNVPIEYRETMNRIGKQLGYNYCPTCNAGLYNLTAQLYNKYLEYVSNISNKNANLKNKTKKKSNSNAESKEEI